MNQQERIQELERALIEADVYVDLLPHSEQICIDGWLKAEHYGTMVELLCLLSALNEKDSG